MTKLHPHYGQCSQCIDRRFAILAAEQEHEDPAEAYKVDLFTGERQAGPDREMALAFVRSASDVHKMTDVAFFAQYGETSRIVGFFPESADMVASRTLDLHQRHAEAICGVFDQAIALHAGALRQGALPADCLLSLVVDQRQGDSPYPAPSRSPELAATVAPEIRIAIDEKRKRVVLDRWGDVERVGAELLIALAESFRQATRKELAPERYPFTKTTNLLRQINCADEETLRKRVSRCRNKIKKLAKKAGDAPPSINAVIENTQWHGYRLNPDQIRIVAISELFQSE